MTKIARALQMSAAACAVAAGASLVTLPVAQATPAAPAPEALGSVLGITCVLTIGDECGTATGTGGGFFYIGARDTTPPGRTDIFKFYPGVPLSLIPVLGPPLAGWFASLNFEACIGGIGARIGPYGSITASVGSSC